MERTFVMALSIMEIEEDDCKDDEGLPITVLSKRHGEMLIGKYYNNPRESLFDWKLITEYNINDLIGKDISIRSPMTCQTKNLRICKKCFGEKDIKTKYVGIVAGQSITERLTQLIMRTFHTSGSAELDTKQYSETVKFIKNHLVDIVYSNDEIILEFDNNNIPDNITTLPGFIQLRNNCSIFKSVTDEVSNIDVISTIKNLKDLIRSQSNVSMTPSEYYLQMVEHMSSVGNVYSSYIEMLFANMFITDIEETKFWRYNREDKILIKLGDKTLAMKISPLLGLLYKPNKQSIQKVSTEEIFSVDNTNRSIYEKIWLGML